MAHAHTYLPARGAGVRPKMWLANDGNYREMRFFTMWDNRNNTRQLEEFQIPCDIAGLIGQEVHRVVR